jgi:hypothetical protein
LLAGCRQLPVAVINYGLLVAGKMVQHKSMLFNRALLLLYLLQYKCATQGTMSSVTYVCSTKKITGYTPKQY